MVEVILDMMLHRGAFLHQFCTDVAWDVNRFMNALDSGINGTYTPLSAYLDVL